MPPSISPGCGLVGKRAWVQPPPTNIVGANAQRFKQRVEVASEDDVWRRKAFLFVEAQLHALTGDLLSLQRVRDAIAELAATFEGWAPWLAFARGAVHRLRGELEPARVELQRFVRRFGEPFDRALRHGL